MQEIKPELSIPAMPKAGIILVGLTWLLVLLVVPILAASLDSYWLGLGIFLIIGAASVFALYRQAAAQGGLCNQVEASIRASAYSQNGLSEHSASSLSVLHVFRQGSKEAQHFRYLRIRAFLVDRPSAPQSPATVMVLEGERSSRVFVRIPLTRCHSLAIRGSTTKAVDRAFRVNMSAPPCFSDHYTATCDGVSEYGGEVSSKMAAVLLENPQLYRQSSFEFDEYGNLVFSFIDPDIFDFAVAPYRLADAGSIEAARNARMVMPRLERTMTFLDSLLQTVE